MLRVWMLSSVAVWMACLLLRTPQHQGVLSTRLALKVRPYFQHAPLRFEDCSLITPAGDTLSISRLALLISDVKLLRADGSQVALNGQFGYLNFVEGRDTLALSQVPNGRYRGITFSIGLDRQTNHADPGRYPADHPLNPGINSLHWSWQGGYVFLALEGRYTRRDGRLGGYVYHLANDPNRMTVALQGDFAIDGETQADIAFDLATVFQGVSPRAGNGAESTHSAPGDHFATRLKANVEHAFRLETVHPEIADSSAQPPATVKAAIPGGTHAYGFVVPIGFPLPSLPADNPLTLEGIALGKRLFLERRLSGNDTQSCASCHRPEAAFSDAGHAFSKGIDGLYGTRRTMPLFNLAWSRSYTWDGQRTRLRDQAIAPIVNPREMHATLATVIRKLERDGEYPTLFAGAFGSPGITMERMGMAMEQFL